MRFLGADGRLVGMSVGKIKELVFHNYYIGTFVRTPLFIHGSTFGFLSALILLTLLTSGLSEGANFAWMLINVFFCVTLHEYGHVHAAQRFGILTRAVHLLPIGGVALLASENRTPRGEIIVAFAGPAVNFILALLAFPVCILLKTFIPDSILLHIAGTFLAVNLILGIFNMIPAFPMDGGRIFRGFVWKFKGYHIATDWAINLSKIFVPIFVIVAIFTKSIMLMLIAGMIWMYCKKNPEEQGMM